MERRHIIQTVVFFVIAYVMTPYLCTLVIDYESSANAKERLKSQATLTLVKGPSAGSAVH